MNLRLAFDYGFILLVSFYQKRCTEPTTKTTRLGGLYRSRLISPVMNSLLLDVETALFPSPLTNPSNNISRTKPEPGAGSLSAVNLQCLWDGVRVPLFYNSGLSAAIPSRFCVMI